jgi:hypothetical protein
MLNYLFDDGNPFYCDTIAAAQICAAAIKVAKTGSHRPDSPTQEERFQYIDPMIEIDYYPNAHMMIWIKGRMRATFGGISSSVWNAPEDLWWKIYLFRKAVIDASGSA